MSLLFVCMGNICRSPTAHGVMRRLVHEAGLGQKVSVSSAGTHSYHVGEAPDPRSIAAARRRGIDLSDLRASVVSPQRVQQADLVLAMDDRNLSHLRRLAPSQDLAKIHLLTAFASLPHHNEVPDPYYGADDGFETVLDLVEDACRGLLVHVCGRLNHPIGGLS